MNKVEASILVVDDIEANREILGRYLKRAGYDDVEMAEGGAKALEMLQKHSYSLVLLDIMMPDVDGFLVLETLRKQFSHTELPVVMISAIDDRKDIVKALDLGANDYITKPFEKKIMLSRVHKQLETGELYQQIKEEKERYALAFSASNDGLMDWNIGTDKVFYSDRWHEMMGSSAESHTDSLEQWFDHVHPDDIKALRKAISKHFCGENECVKHEYRALYAEESYHWMLLSAKALFTEEGKPIRLTASQSDISATKTFDPITGLPNSQVFMDRLNRLFSNSMRTGNVSHALLSLTLNNREKIMAAIGPFGYDILNNKIAKKLLDSLRADDYLSQNSEEITTSCMSGNRYMILIENLEGHAEEILKVSERLYHLITQPFIISNESIHCDISIGIVNTIKEGENVEDLIKNCITAENMARTNDSRMNIYDTDMHGRAIDRLHLENELRIGIHNGELRAHYQPIIHLGSGKERGSESLIRWQHPEKGLLSPYHFITLAEETGLIDDIDAWIFRESCRQHMLLPESERESRFISANVSVKQLNVGWIERINAVVQEFSMPLENIHLEITESIFMGNIEETIKLLNELSATGISFAIDDFGTGYSSFCYLRRLPVKYLKIDKTFVDNIVMDAKDRSLVQSIIDMGQGLGMKIIAEGIEHKEQAESLLEMGCDYGQGYYFGRPVPAQ